ncbi:MAG: hypothetical protein OZ922_00030 [Myxococcales bacterium]|jgi:hypothetical protein|nr:hypothetical protein [Myxococcales bacterium]
MNNSTRTIFKLFFERDLHLLKNSICEQCDAQIRHPLLPWLVGEKFSESAERILFVGKPHRGTPGEILPSGMLDPTDMVANKLWDISWPYWSYTREIAKNLYGDNAPDFIAFTNLIKCTNVGADDGESTSTDKTTRRMAECCVLKLGVIWKEIERLEARTIIFYTYGLFREMLQDIPVARKETIRETTRPGLHCGRKPLGWWERSCETAWTDNFRVLVVGHPERMHRAEFVKLITNWIRTDPLSQSARQ